MIDFQQVDKLFELGYENDLLVWVQQNDLIQQITPSASSWQRCKPSTSI